MSKHIKKRKMQFAAFSLTAAFGVLFGSMGLKQLGAHELFTTHEAKAAPTPAEHHTEPAADVAFDASVAGILPPIGKDDATFSVPILLYHGLVDQRDRFSMTPETFRDQLFALKRDGYHSITVDDLLKFREGGALPARSFLLTFDDGRLDSYVQADPVLKATGFTAVMFIAGEQSLGVDPATHNAYYLTLPDLRAMVDSGRWEIESHALQMTGGQIPIDAQGTLGNFLSNKQWLAREGRLENDAEYRQRVQQEIGSGKSRIQNRLHVRVEAMSYPYGDFGQQQVNNPDAEKVIAEVMEKTYKVAFRQVWDNDPMPKPNEPNEDHLKMKRIEVPTGWSGDQLVRELASLMPKTLPFDDTFAEDDGWRSTWGTAVVENDALALKATATSTGADAIIDGARHWKNYAMEARYDWLDGDRFTLMARYRNEDDYLQCVFGGGRVRLDRVFGGKSTMLAERVTPVPTLDGTAGVQVYDHAAACTLGGTVVVQATVPSADGAVGFKVWHPEKNHASLRIRELRVTPLQVPLPSSP